MEKSRWVRWDRLMRASHLYTGLLLVPWMSVYAVSAFCLNHSVWFSNPPETGPKWAVVRETEFPLDTAFPQDPQQQAKAILKHLDLDGAYRVPGDPQANPLTIYRSCAAGQYRVTWHRQPSRLVVERYGPTSFYVVVNNLHFQHGYDQETVAYCAWAVIVDVVTVSTVIWVISGVYLWARRPRKRLLGGVCLARLNTHQEKLCRAIFTKHCDLDGSHYAYTEGHSDAQNERHFTAGAALRLWEPENGEAKVRTLLDDPHGVPDAFRWEGPDGGSVLVYYQGGYGGFAGAIGPSSYEDILENLPGKLDAIEKQGSSLSVVRYIHNGVDNFPPDVVIGHVVRQWNDRWAYPKLVVATNAMFFEHLEKQCPDVRTFRGELPDTDYVVGAASTALETGINRVTHDRLHAAEKFATVASLLADYPRLPDTSFWVTTHSQYSDLNRAIGDAYENALLYDEHTWGMANSVGVLQDWSWSDKSRYAYKAAGLTESILGGSLGAIADRIALDRDGQHLVVFNSLSVARTDVVRVSSKGAGYGKFLDLADQQPMAEKDGRAGTSGYNGILATAGLPPDVYTVQAAVTAAGGGPQTSQRQIILAPDPFDWKPRTGDLESSR